MGMPFFEHALIRRVARPLQWAEYRLEREIRKQTDKGRSNQNESVGGNNQEIRFVRSESLQRGERFQIRRLFDRKTGSHGRLFNQTRSQASPAASRSIRLRVYRNDIDSGVGLQRLQAGYGKSRCTGKYSSNGFHNGVPQSPDAKIRAARCFLAPVD